MTQRYFALIPAAGTGARFGAQAPKQFLPLAGRSMLEHALDALLSLPELARVLVVVAPGESVLRLPERSRVAFAAVGGATRAASVRNGLQVLEQSQAAQDDDWVLVHDAARPCVAPEELRSLIDTLRADAVGGLLALPLADTVKRARDGCSVETLDRSELWRAATPQMFRLGTLRRALDAAGAADVTDEAAAVERLGLTPRLVEGWSTNIKVTRPEDALIAEAILAARRR